MAGSHSPIRLSASLTSARRYALQGYSRRREAFMALEADGPYTELRVVAILATLVAFVINACCCMLA